MDSAVFLSHVLLCSKVQNLATARALTTSSFICMSFRRQTGVFCTVLQKVPLAGQRRSSQDMMILKNSLAWHAPETLAIGARQRLISSPLLVVGAIWPVAPLGLDGLRQERGLHE